MSDSNPEEDGVDQRVGQQSRLSGEVPGGADAGGADDQPYRAGAPYQAEPYQAQSAFAAAAEPAARADSAGPDHPNGKPADAPPPPLVSENRRPPPYPAQLLARPYPAQRRPQRSLAARIAAPFLARSRVGAADPGRRPEGERSSRPMAARVTAPVQGWEKTAAGKPTRPPQGSPIAQGGGPSTRRAQLILSRIEPWSVMKFSFMISLVGWVILFVAVTVLYFVLSKLGVFHALQTTITSVTSSKDSPGADAGSGWFSASRVLGYTMLVGAVNVILITALATVGSVIYNLVTHIAGGIEVTLKETD